MGDRTDAPWLCVDGDSGWLGGWVLQCLELSPGPRPRELSPLLLSVSQLLLFNVEPHCVAHESCEHKVLLPLCHKYLGLQAQLGRVFVKCLVLCPLQERQTQGDSSLPSTSPGLSTL